MSQWCSSFSNTTSVPSEKLKEGLGKAHRKEHEMSVPVIRPETIFFFSGRDWMCECVLPFKIGNMLKESTKGIIQRTQPTT